MAVAIVALGAYITVRKQLQSSLDDSLVDRAKHLGRQPRCSHDLRRPGAAAVHARRPDVRIAFDPATTGRSFLDEATSSASTSHELAVATGEIRVRACARSAPNGTDYRVVAVPTSHDRATRWCSRSRWTPQQNLLTKLGLVTLLFGIAGMITAGVAGWAVARNGLRPVRRLTAAAEEIARTERLAPIQRRG